MPFNWFKQRWIRFWMHRSSLTPLGRFSTRMATLVAPHYKNRIHLSYMNSKGYISPSAVINHSNLKMKGHVYIGDRCVVYECNGGSVILGRESQLYSDIIIETGQGGSVDIGAETHIQPRCQLMGYAGNLKIGCRVEIAPNCAFYPYDHCFVPGVPIRNQGLKSKGGINIGDDVWLGVNVIVLDGLHIGEGAVVGAGSVVTKDIPAGAIAFGVPARVEKMRTDL